MRYARFPKLDMSSRRVAAGIRRDHPAAGGAGRLVRGRGVPITRATSSRPPAISNRVRRPQPDSSIRPVGQPEQAGRHDPDGRDSVRAGLHGESEPRSPHANQGDLLGSVARDEFEMAQPADTTATTTRRLVVPAGSAPKVSYRKRTCRRVQMGYRVEVTSISARATHVRTEATDYFSVPKRDKVKIPSTPNPQNDAMDEFRTP